MMDEKDEAQKLASEEATESRPRPMTPRVHQPEVFAVVPVVIEELLLPLWEVAVDLVAVVQWRAVRRRAVD